MNSGMRKSHIISIALVCATLGLAYVAHAQGFVALAPAPATGKIGSLYGSTSLTDFINKLFQAALALGAILAVLRLAFAGYMYMTTDIWGKKGEAKTIIGEVVMGILLLFSIYLILKQINPQILNLDVLQGL